MLRRQEEQRVGGLEDWRVSKTSTHPNIQSSDVEVEG